MKLSKPMLRLFGLVLHGRHTIAQLCAATGLAHNWVSEVLIALEREGFVHRQRTGATLSVRATSSAHAQALKEMLLAEPAIDFSAFITGARLCLLACCALDWKDRATLSTQARISAKTIRMYTPALLNRGILLKRQGMLRLNQEGWPLLYPFIRAYRLVPAFPGRVRWQFAAEMLVERENTKAGEGSPTGFARYGEFGVPVQTIRTLWFHPRRELSREEIFVHSLFEVEDLRSLHLALVFFVKNRLDRSRVGQVALRFDQHSRFQELLTLLDLNGEEHETTTSFDQEGFARIARLYGVDHVFPG